MKRKEPQAAKRKTADFLLQPIFAGLFGGLLGLSLLKFGNPILLERLVEHPSGHWEWLLNPWPITIGYWLLAGVTLLGLTVARWRITAPKILVAMPLLWLVWEMIAATQSEVPKLSWPTVGHFVTCVVCFYLGLVALSRIERLWPFWTGLLVGFFIVLAFGFEQHFGGLAQSQKYWFLYVYPTLKEVPPGLLKKMSTNRIFATLFYPNTLAGAILMLLPVTLALFWSSRKRFTIGARVLLMGIAGAGALACLYWSGSKGGWLLMLVIGFVAAMYLPIQRRVKMILIIAVLAIGLAGFFVKYAGYFSKGAKSVEARRDYWEAAVKTTAAKPLFGNGPGTFGRAYARLKRPESEMSLMVHNDYLEQACDSGLPGCVVFTAFIVGSLVHVWRHGGLQKDWVKLAVWLGLLGWALQELVEFGLYIPALSWPAFGFVGWLLARSGNQFDSRTTAS